LIHLGGSLLFGYILSLAVELGGIAQHQSIFGVLDRNLQILKINSGVLKINSGVLKINSGVLKINSGILKINSGVLRRNVWEPWNNSQVLRSSF